MRAIKLTLAIVFVALLLLVTPLMLADVLDSYCVHKGASFFLWLVIFFAAVAMVHVNLPKKDRAHGAG